MSASADLRRTADAVSQVPRSAMIAAAKAVKAIAADEARPATMHGHKKRAIKLRARDKDLPARPGTARMRVYGTPVGPWVWITDGTDPHPVRRRKKGPMRKMVVHHPGTRGHGAWKRVITRATTDVPPIFRRALIDAVQRS